jgi:hypothetical protein
VSWFINDSLNIQQTLNSCMEAVAEKVLLLAIPPKADDIEQSIDRSSGDALTT